MISSFRIWLICSATYCKSLCRQTRFSLVAKNEQYSTGQCYSFQGHKTNISPASSQPFHRKIEEILNTNTFRIENGETLQARRHGPLGCALVPQAMGVFSHLCSPAAVPAVWQEAFSPIRYTGTARRCTCGLKKRCHSR